MKNIHFMIELIVLSLFLAGCQNHDSSPCEDRNVVDTSTGSFCGIDNEGVTSYKGIKYADASQNNRWKVAAQVDDFSTPILADKFGDICSQEKQGAYARPPMSEDCLYLNVWAPSDANTSKLKKVMVYIHGGAYLRGSGSQPVYNGSNLVNKNDVIVVTFNYRLGVLGFLSLPESTGSGNFGLMDQQMAIQWVYDNIENFGGDKESITIFGNSAGSTSVGIHLANESQITPYIKRGIIQSPYMGLPLKDKEFAKTVGKDTVSALIEKCEYASSECIYDLDASSIVGVELSETILADYFLFHKLASVFPYHPYIDEVIVNNDLIQSSISKPLLIGNSKDESNFIIIPIADAGGLPTTRLAYHLYLDVLFGKTLAEKIVVKDRYKFNEDDASDVTYAKNLFSDFAFVCASRRFLGFSSAQNYLNNTTYLYSNAYQSSFNYWGSDANVTMAKSCEAPAVCHQAEIPYVFDNYYDNNANPVTSTGEEKQFSQKLMRLWGDFAITGLAGNFNVYNPIDDNAIEFNNTSPNFFETYNYYETRHNCDLWKEYYDAMGHPTHE
ncbi:Para-nitrobenzyl esterase [Halioglobus japonicus]|nr:Para-nitrobenzyl esterase [Halioglobus japonicus]